MGLIYVRLGKPDNWVNYLCEDCIQNFSWHYYKTYNQPEMIFHFIKHGGARGWMLETLPTYFENRWELGNPYVFLDPSRGQSFKPDDILMYSAQLKENNLKYAKEGVHTESSDFKFDAEPLILPFQFLSFKGENGLTNVELYYALQGKDIKLISEPGRNFIALSKFIGIYDQNWDEIFKIKKSDRFLIRANQDSWQKGVVMQMEHFQAKPGNYFYEIQIKDEAGGKLGVFRDNYNVMNYNIDSLAISDILMSAKLLFNQKGTRYKKGTVSYNPHMFTQFREGESLGLYFEVYNLVYDVNDRTNFQTRWSLKQIDDEAGSSIFSAIAGFFGGLFSAEEEQVEANLDYDGSTRDDKVYLNLDLQNQDAGRYELSITLEDKNSSQQVGKQIEFVIE
jgi:hypothetical protein